MFVYKTNIKQNVNITGRAAPTFAADGWGHRP